MHKFRQIRIVLLMAAIVPSARGADKPPPLAFGTARPAATSRGFNKAAMQADGLSSERDRDYARGLLKKYDANGDRVLQKDEWERIRGTPEKADANSDGRITYDELVARVTNKRRDDAVASATNSDDRRSYRLTSATAKLPEGLPSWFVDRDTNGDGQVAMHEYSRRWSDSTARRFVSLDANDDGLITPSEATK